MDEKQSRKRHAWRDSLRLNRLQGEGLPPDLCGMDSLLHFMNRNLADELLLHYKTLRQLSENYRLLYFAGLVKSDEVRGIQDETLRIRARWTGMLRSMALDTTEMAARELTPPSPDSDPQHQ
jgi:hypothetical protein